MSLWLTRVLSSFLLTLELILSVSVLQLNVEQLSCSWEMEVSSALFSGTVLVEGVGPGWEGELFM